MLLHRRNSAYPNSRTIPPFAIVGPSISWYRNNTQLPHALSSSRAPQCIERICPPKIWTPFLSTNFPLPRKRGITDCKECKRIPSLTLMTKRIQPEVQQAIHKQTQLLYSCSLNMASLSVYLSQMVSSVCTWCRSNAKATRSIASATAKLLHTRHTDKYFACEPLQKNTFRDRSRTKNSSRV